MEEKTAESSEGQERIRRAKFRLGRAVVRLSGDLSEENGQQPLRKRGRLDGGGDTLTSEARQNANDKDNGK